MSISDGLRVNAANSNAAWVSKTTDDTTTGKLGLNKGSEGAAVVSTQKALNTIFDATGLTGENDVDGKNYASNNYIADGDNHKEALESLDAQLKTTTDLAEGLGTNLVTTTGTQILTNKDYDGGTASNSSRVTIPKATKATLDSLTRKEGTIVYATDTDKLYADNGAALVPIGSSSGLKNYITNGDAETSTTGWATYSDAAGVRPVDGTSGTANITWTTTSTTPIEGTNSFLFTKDAVNRQGQGVSYDFDIDLADQAKVLTIELDYMVNSGTFVAGTSSTNSDVIVYLYDKDNAVLLEPSSIKLLSNSTTLTDRFKASFQTASNSNSYRLILHCSSTSASAYTLKIDSVKVSPSTYSYGTPITDWQSYTPTFTGFGTPTGTDFLYRRVGDSIHVRGFFTSGTSTAVDAQISLPLGFSIPTLSTAQIAGHGVRSAGASAYTRFYGMLAISGATTVKIGNIDPAVTTDPLTPLTGSVFISSGQSLRVDFTVKCSGLSSSVQMSDQTDTRVVAVQLGGAAVATTAQTPIIFPTVTNDTHGAYNSVTGRYLVQVSGYYKVTLYSLATIAAGQFAYVSVNAATPSGTNSPRLGNSVNANDPLLGSGLVFAKAGDFIDIRPNVAYGATNAVSTASIERISGPNQIAANELILGVATGNPASATSGNPFIFSTLVVNTHGALNSSTGRFTCPISGSYEIIMNFTATGGGNATIFGYKNAASFGSAGHFHGSLVGGVVYIIIPCVAGDIIDLRPNSTIDISDGQISFKRLGF
jgi:hypothetical protein